MGTTIIGTGHRFRRREMGGAAIKLIISLIVLAIVGQALYVFIPIYIAVYDFTSQVDKEAQFGAQKRDSQIKDGLLQYANDLRLPVEKENIKVTRAGGELKVTADFTVPVETLLYTYQWQVSAEKAYPLF